MTFSWVATNPSPPFEPDAAVIALGKISGIQIMLKPQMSNKPGLGLKVMAQQIQQGCMKGLYKPNNPWATAPGSLSGIPPLTLTVSNVPNREASMLRMATEITLWFTSYVPSIPCAGTRTKYIGVATPTKIS